LEDTTLKNAMVPGPGSYQIRQEDKQEGTAKSMLGGSLEQKKDEYENKVPGPGTYNPSDMKSIPGFRIEPDQN
jgi:hypothetical protein